MNMTQKPDAPRVEGYGAKDKSTGWLSVGQQVRKGEIALKIWRPMIMKDPHEAQEAGGHLRAVLPFTLSDVILWQPGRSSARIEARMDESTSMVHAAP
jgi:hypothetical protein